MTEEKRDENGVFQILLNQTIVCGLLASVVFGAFEILGEGNGRLLAQNLAPFLASIAASFVVLLISQNLNKGVRVKLLVITSVLIYSALSLVMIYKYFKYVNEDQDLRMRLLKSALIVFVYGIVHSLSIYISFQITERISVQFARIPGKLFKAFQYFTQAVGALFFAAFLSAGIYSALYRGQIAAKDKAYEEENAKYEIAKTEFIKNNCRVPTIDEMVEIRKKVPKE